MRKIQSNLLPVLCTLLFCAPSIANALVGGNDEESNDAPACVDASKAIQLYATAINQTRDDAEKIWSRSRAETPKDLQIPFTVSEMGHFSDDFFERVHSESKTCYHSEEEVSKKIESIRKILQTHERVVWLKTKQVRNLAQSKCDHDRAVLDSRGDEIVEFDSGDGNLGDPDSMKYECNKPNKEQWIAVREKLRKIMKKDPDKVPEEDEDLMALLDDTGKSKGRYVAVRAIAGSVNASATDPDSTQQLSDDGPNPIGAHPAAHAAP